MDTPDSRYSLPNNEIDKERLDLQHELFKLTVGGKLTLIPIPGYQQDNIGPRMRVLDAGCGTGIWAIEFAKQFPDTEVVGVDINLPHQDPTTQPDNCSFKYSDINSTSFPQSSTSSGLNGVSGWDVIHSRAMVAVIGDWPSFIERGFDALRPGGYLELQDFAVRPKLKSTNKPVKIEETYHYKWCEIFKDGECIYAGHDLLTPDKWIKWLTDAGFIDIHLQYYFWPLGPRGQGERMKELGTMALKDWLAAKKFPREHMIRSGFTNEEADEFLGSWEKELTEQQLCLYMEPCFCYARKPITAAK